MPHTAPAAAASKTAARQHARLERACAEQEPPFACVDLDAFEANAGALTARAGGTPIRVASKSLRCRALLDATLARTGFAGLLCFTLPEALWLAEQGGEDLVIAYPTTDRGALARLGGEPALAEQVTVMVDDRAQLDLIEAAIGGAPARPVRVCLDVDAGWRALGGRVRIGPKRSPVHDPAEAAALARDVVARAAFELDGLMAYEGQIAGVGDRPPGRPLLGAAIAAMQALSARELAARRAQVVAAVRAVAPLRFVNGGGTGSVERTVREPAVTEVAAGSGLYGPTLFDAYRAFTVRPAAQFVLPVVRRPGRGVATVLGGGYLASGAPGADRLPRPYHPPGLKLDRAEGAGEVQTPLLGAAADRLAVGDRVWFRHAKAGELCERFDRLVLVRGDRIVDEVPTYRGEGRCFL